jgi:hypothetical protein
MLLALDVMALVFRPITPSLSTDTMLKVLTPLALVSATVYVQVDAFSVSTIALPLAVVHVASQFGKTTISAGLIEPQLSFIDAHVKLLVHAVAVTVVAVPLTCVNVSATVYLYPRPFLKLRFQKSDVVIDMGIQSCLFVDLCAANVLPRR